MTNCVYCQREIQNKGSLKAHENCCKSNPNRKIRKRSPNAGVKKGNVPWNKGVSVEEMVATGKWSKEKADSVIKRLENNGKNSLGKASTEESEINRRNKISAYAKLNNGGYRKGSGRGKKGWYKGFYCDSSYELAFVVYCLEHNIKIERNLEKRQYWFEGKQRNYYPDFVVDGRLVEIKGYVSEQWKAKILYNPDVVVYYKEDMKHIFEFVVGKYGDDYLKLYED